MQAGITDGFPARAIGGDFPVITAEGLPPDKEVARASASPEPEADAEPFVEGLFVKFTVQGDVPEKMPAGRPLREQLGKTGGLAFVAFDKVRACRGQATELRL